MSEGGELFFLKRTHFAAGVQDHYFDAWGLIKSSSDSPACVT